MKTVVLLEIQIKVTTALAVSHELGKSVYKASKLNYY